MSVNGFFGPLCLRGERLQPGESRHLRDKFLLSRTSAATAAVNTLRTPGSKSCSDFPIMSIAMPCASIHSAKARRVWSSEDPPSFFGQLPSHRVQCRPSLAAGSPPGARRAEKFIFVLIEQLVFMRMAQSIVHIALADLFRRLRSFRHSRDLCPHPLHQGPQNVFPVFEPPVERGRIGPRGFGDGAHGESLFAALGPQLAGSV